MEEKINLKIHFFTKDDQRAASSRLRAYFIANELNKLGYSTKIYPIGFDWKSRNSFFDNLRSFFKYLKLLLSFGQNDVIVLQRTIYNKYFFLAVLAARFSKKYIFDFDDAIFVHSPFKTFIMVKLAKTVTCGSHFILDWAKRYNPQSFYFPTSLPFDIYPSFTKNYNIKSGHFIIGWTGDGLTHFENLELLKPIFKKLIERGIKFKFILIGAKNDERIYRLFGGIEKLDIEIIDSLDGSDPSNIAREIQKFDVGIMPLLDNEWSRGKCALKAIEYMACGVATVCSAVGENNYLINDGVNGFLAKSADEWCAKIERLASDKELRMRLGKEGQKTVKEKYSFKTNIPKLISILEKIR